jgi:hypothetical protein
MLYQEPSRPAPDPNSPAKRAKLPDDEVQQRLREAARRRRPWNVGSCLLTVLLIAVPVGLLTWWFWPRALPPKMMVIAFDQVAVQGKPVTVRAATHPLEGDERWGGLEVFFKELTLGAAPTAVPARTDPQGVAEVSWTPKGTGPVIQIEAIYIDKDQRPPWDDKAQVRVFLWPRESRLLAVDVEPLLKGKADGAAAALAAARTAGWRIAYLAASADSPLAYRKLHHAALDLHTLEKQPLPDGPVLARLKLLDGTAEAEARKALLASLQDAFAGPLLYVSSAGGLKVGPVAGPAAPLAGWADLAAALPK